MLYRLWHCWPPVRVSSPEALQAIACECLCISRPCMGTYASGSADRGVLCCWPCISSPGKSPWLAWRGHVWLCVAAMGHNGSYCTLFPDWVAGVCCTKTGLSVCSKVGTLSPTHLDAVCLCPTHRSRFTHAAAASQGACRAAATAQASHARHCPQPAPCTPHTAQAPGVAAAAISCASTSSCQAAAAAAFPRYQQACSSYASIQ